MPILNPALNYSFASQEAMRIAAAERGAEEAIAAQLRQAANNAPLQVGSTVTARYKYKVAEDGSLVPLQTQITTEADEGEINADGRRSGRQAYREDENRRRATFYDILRPKPELSPSDELAIFATLNNAQIDKSEAKIAAISIPASEVPAFAEVVDDNGDFVMAEILTPQQTRNNETPKSSFTPSAQFSVATLYARNNDIVYNVTPIAQLAA